MTMASLDVKTIKSAERVLQVLEFFDGTHTKATVMEISRQLGYPQSSTSELLRCLVKMGYLNYDRYRRTYEPTARVPLLGAWVQPGLFRHGHLHPMLDEVSRRCGRLPQPRKLHARALWLQSGDLGGNGGTRPARAAVLRRGWRIRRRRCRDHARDGGAWPGSCSGAVSVERRALRDDPEVCGGQQTEKCATVASGRRRASDGACAFGTCRAARNDRWHPCQRAPHPV